LDIVPQVLPLFGNSCQRMLTWLRFHNLIL
jgi:hypothetical protein